MPAAADRRRAPVPEPPARRAPSAAEHVRISGGQRKALQGAVLAGVQSLSRSARILLDAAAAPDEPDPGGLLTAAGGLYTYAVEEHGKLLLLESLPEKGGIVSVPYREIFRSHEKKFEAAFKDLPADCAQLKWGLFDPHLFDPRLFDTGLGAGFAGRTNLLYIDIVHDGRFVAPDVPDPEQLAKAVAGLKEAVEKRAAQGGLAGPAVAQSGMGGGR